MQLPFFAKRGAAPLDFLAIGDTVVDDFIRLTDARTHCNLDDESCEICMRWGDKIPFESSTHVAGVGNAANAAVSAARLGLSCALVTNVGDDRYGEEIRDALAAEKLDTRYIATESGKRTNYHYVLWFESERTILVKHETYTYSFPKDLPPVKALYLSSLGEVPDAYYDEIASFAESRPDLMLAFQPGTFQMKMGTERLSRIYKRSNLFFCNKEEAERILGLPGGSEIAALLDALHALGPKTVVITDGRNGAYASDGSRKLFVPMYPDHRDPKERTGAGDAFASTVTAALALGEPLEQALLWGPINSMCVVQEIGAQKGLLPRVTLETYLKDAPEEYRTTPLA